MASALVRVGLRENSTPVAVRGQGCYVFDNAGKRYLDGSGGALIVTIGHGVAEIGEAVAAQMKKLAYVFRAHFSNEPAEELAQMLISEMPLGFSRILFTSSGSEAVESAIKAARQYHFERGEHGRHKIISRLDSYHGVTLGAMSATGMHAMKDAGSWRSLQIPVRHINTVRCDDCPFHLKYPSCQTFCASELERAIIEEGPGSVAAFIVEPSRGEEPPSDYWPTIREICDRYGVLLIADEVACGLWRTGRAYCVDHWNIVPDLLTFGKAAASGYAPLAGLAMSDRILDVLINGSGVFLHGHTHSANPMSCAAGLAVQRYVREHGLDRGVAGRGAALDQMLHRVVARHEMCVHTCGIGLLRQLALRPPRGTNLTIASLVLEALSMRFGLISQYWKAGDRVGFQLAPPYIITDAQILELEERLDRIIPAFAGWLAANRAG